MQRVQRASVTVADEVIGTIEAGLLVLLGVAAGDDESDVRWLAEKLSTLRVFNDDDGKMNRSLVDTGGAMLIVSQFTLLGDCRKGRRPGFDAAALPAVAEALYEQFVDAIRALNIPVATGRFRADMQVALVNDGPVTLLVDSKKLF